MNESLQDLELRRRNLFRLMQDLGDFRRGTISVNYRKCGKSNCACARKNHPGHGPQYLWNVSVGGGLSRVAYTALKKAGVPALVEFERVDAADLAHAPGLRLVGVARGTQMTADLPALTERGVLVITTPGRNAASVAELTIAFAVMLARQVGPAMAQVREQQWTERLETFLEFRGRELGDLVLGIVGYGAVGTLVSFVVAYASIAWLLRYIAKHSFNAFVIYRIIIGLVVIGLLATNTIDA